MFLNYLYAKLVVFFLLKLLLNFYPALLFYFYSLEKTFYYSSLIYLGQYSWQYKKISWNIILNFGNNLLIAKKNTLLRFIYLINGNLCIKYSKSTKLFWYLLVTTHCSFAPFLEMQKNVVLPELSQCSLDNHYFFKRNSYLTLS